ncbi:MAG: SDR family NAD(P)-dependent oxidoreductase, partial [Nitrososphaerota archaeon]
MSSPKVLITGVTGFIGSHLAPRLLELGYDVYSFERYMTGRYVLGAIRQLKTLFGDLREYHTVRKVVRDVSPDYVIHLAAISPVAYSFEHPQEVMDVNLMGTINLSEACLHEAPGVKQMLFASTSEVYGDGPVPRREDTPPNPNSPYAVSKLAAEKYLLYLKEAYDFPVT